MTAKTPVNMRCSMRALLICMAICTLLAILACRAQNEDEQNIENAEVREALNADEDGDVENEADEDEVGDAEEAEAENDGEDGVVCNDVASFPVELFAAHPDTDKVYATPSVMPEGAFFTMGFVKYVTVFGIHIVGSKEVSDEALTEAARFLASIVDNDMDGKPDRQKSIDSVVRLRTIMGYVKDSDDSKTLWGVNYEKPGNKAFRDQFVCNMHFFEQQASDATRFSTAMARRLPGVGTCSALEGVDFDFRLWYFHFTLVYYGYLEDLSEEILNENKAAMGRALADGMLVPSYPGDSEMEMANYFVWSMLTKMGLLECHCKTEAIETKWKLCTADDLKAFDSQWVDTLDSIEGLPRFLPTATYDVSSPELLEK